MFGVECWLFAGCCSLFFVFCEARCVLCCWLLNAVKCLWIVGCCVCVAVVYRLLLSVVWCCLLYVVCSVLRFVVCCVLLVGLMFVVCWLWFVDRCSLCVVGC